MHASSLEFGILREMMSGGSCKLERKVVEKNRRTQMKHLCLKLVSLIPPHHFNPPKEFLSQQDQIDQAAAYIQNLTHRVDELRSRKARTNPTHHHNTKRINAPTASTSHSLPILKIREIGSNLEVVVIIGPTIKFALNRAVRVIEEEGAEVVTLSISNVGHKIFHTLHAQAKLPRVGVDISRICGRLEELMVV